MMSDENAVENALSLSKRPEWADIDPIKQDDGPNPACPILYSPEYSEAMDYFRAVLKAQELSQRAFDLTTEIIDFNPAHYTIWHYRRRVIDAIGVDLNEELAYISEIIASNLKNYQVWHHREQIMRRLSDPSAEMEFTKHMLRQDAKNYHAWTYRQWAMKHFNLFDKLRERGLGFVDDLLTEDVFNNSAWNHRHFVIVSTGGYTEDRIDEEIEYALRKIKDAPSNEASTNYLRGVLQYSSRKAWEFENVAAALGELMVEDPPSPHVVNLMLFLQEERAEACGDDKDKQAAQEAAISYCELLQKIDPVRVKYWKHRAKKITALQ